MKSNAEAFIEGLEELFGEADAIKRLILKMEIHQFMCFLS